MSIPPTYSQSNLDVKKTKTINEFHIFDPVKLKNKSQKNIEKRLDAIKYILKTNVITEARKKYKNIENAVGKGYFTSFICRERINGREFIDTNDLRDISNFDSLAKKIGHEINCEKLFSVKITGKATINIEEYNRPITMSFRFIWE